MTLTAKGARKWQRVMQVIARRNEEIFGCLTAAEQERLSGMFDRMIAHAKANSDDTVEDA